MVFHFDLPDAATKLGHEGFKIFFWMSGESLNNDLVWTFDYLVTLGSYLIMVNMLSADIYIKHLVENVDVVESALCLKKVFAINWSRWWSYWWWASFWHCSGWNGSQGGWMWTKWEWLCSSCPVNAIMMAQNAILSLPRETQTMMQIEVIKIWTEG